MCNMEKMKKSEIDAVPDPGLREMLLGEKILILGHFVPKIWPKNQILANFGPFFGIFKTAVIS